VADEVMQHPNEDLGAAFSRLQASLRSYLRRRVSDATLVEDLLQETFLKALTSKRAGRQIDNLSGWLFATARTTLVDHYRATSLPAEALDENMPESEPTDDLQLHTEVAHCLTVFIHELAPLYRDTLVATDLEGETMRSIAEQQAVTVSAIKSRAARGRAMLKEKLLQCCQVKMAAGLVTDYYRTAPSSCNGKCTK
jgi:RNA polymerase sigma-70 factor, ECF subfamily